MQIINVTNRVMKYHTKGTTIVLNPGVITYISEELTTAKKLKDCYGNRISIIDDAKIMAEYNAFSGNAKPVEPPIQDAVNEILEDNNSSNEDGIPVVEDESTTEGTKEPPEEGIDKVTLLDDKTEDKEPKKSKPKKSGKGSKKNK